MLITVEVYGDGVYGHEAADSRVPVRGRREALRFARRMMRRHEACGARIWYLFPDGTKADGRNADEYVAL